MTKYYGYFRITTQFMNYGEDNEEFVGSFVTFNGIFDLEEARKLLEKNYNCEVEVFDVGTLKKTDSYFKVLREDNGFTTMITEFFDDFEVNKNYGQEVYFR